MSPGLRDLTRLAELAPENDPAQVALLIQSARQAPDEPLPLVKWRIQNTLRRRTEWNRRGLRLALVGALVFLAGGVVGAIAGPLLGSRRSSAPPQPVVTSSPAQSVRHANRRVPTPAIPLPPAEEPLVAVEPSALPAPAAPLQTKPEPAPSPSPLPVGERVAATDRRYHLERGGPSTVAQRTPAPPEPASLLPPPPALPPPEPSKTPIPAGRIALGYSPIVPAREHNVPSEIRQALPSHTGSSASPLPRPPSTASRVAPPPDEHALLKTALQRLRTAHDPVSALAALDDYRVRFPSGGLAPEAAMLRAEALLQIGRKGDALAELDRLSLAQMPNSEERYLLRGELRAAVGRWREAKGDFDVVLRDQETEIGASMKSPDRSQRALWGRALTRSRLGDDVGARADLQECLRRFPQGRFASEATRLLAGQR